MLLNHKLVKKGGARKQETHFLHFTLRISELILNKTKEKEEFKKNIDFTIEEIQTRA